MLFFPFGTGTTTRNPEIGGKNMEDDVMAWAKEQNLQAHQWRQLSFSEKIKKVDISPDKFEEYFNLCMIFFECFPSYNPGFSGLFSMNIPNIEFHRNESYLQDGIFEARNPFTGKDVSYLSNDENDQKIYNFQLLINALDVHKDDYSGNFQPSCRVHLPNFI